MENASKALIMAGSVLIALMIIGSLLLMFNNLSNYQNTNVKNTREAQIVEFNNQYETYNRTDVRGSDICSLLNKAEDYNERKSSVGKEGAEIAYTPIEIEVKIDNYLLSAIASPTYKGIVDSGNNLIKSTVSSYKVTGTTNEFKENVQKEIDTIESKYGGQSIMTKLVTNISKIYDATADEAKIKAYKEVTGKTLSITQINNNCKDVCMYYEYIQFKRVYFDCKSDDTGKSGVEYDTNTGRIIKMTFVYNGKIE